MKVEDSPGQKRRLCAGAWVSADSALKMKGSGTPKKHHRTSKSTERAYTFESKFARLHVRFHTRLDVCIAGTNMEVENGPLEGHFPLPC